MKNWCSQVRNKKTCGSGTFAFPAVYERSVSALPVPPSRREAESFVNFKQTCPQTGVLSQHQVLGWSVQITNLIALNSVLRLLTPQIGVSAGGWQG